MTVRTKPEHACPGGHGISDRDPRESGASAASRSSTALRATRFSSIGVGTMIAAMFYGMSRSLGRVASALEHRRECRPAVAVSAGSFVAAGRRRAADPRLACARRGGRPNVDHHLRDRRIAAGLPALRFLDAERNRLVACRRRAALGVRMRLRGRLVAVAEGHLGCGAGASDRLSRLVGRLPASRAGVPADADDRIVPLRSATDLCRLHADPLDRADLDTRPTRGRSRSHRLLPDRSAVEGGALPPAVRRRRSWHTPARSPTGFPRLAAGRARNDLSIYGASADWWGDDARWLQALRNMVPARLAAFDPIVGDWKDRRVLDLGCGGGFMAEALAKRGAVVTGIDPSTAAIAAARVHAGSSTLAIDYRVGSGEALPFGPDAFDIVVCVDVLEHIETWDQVVSEVRRVLRPGGLFLFDTINRNPLAAFVIVTIGENVIGLLPPRDPRSGIVHPALGVRDERFRCTVSSSGRFAGFGPRGLNRRSGMTFGRLPFTAVQYLGSAQLAAN